MNWKNWIGKKAHIILNNGYEYNCFIDDVYNSGDNIIFFNITDKFNSKITFNSNQIKFIEEKNDGRQF